MLAGGESMDDEVRRIALAGSTVDGVVDVRDLVHLVLSVEGFLDPGWLTTRLAELGEWVAQNSDPVLQAKLLPRWSGPNGRAAVPTSGVRTASHKAQPRRKARSTRSGCRCADQLRCGDCQA